MIQCDAKYELDDERVYKYRKFWYKFNENSNLMKIISCYSKNTQFEQFYISANDTDMKYYEYASNRFCFKGYSREGSKFFYIISYRDYF